MNRSNHPNAWYFVIVAMLSVCTFSSSTCAQEKKATRFDKAGVRFEYTKGWKVGSDDTFGSTRLVIVHGPENSIVTIQFTESTVAESLKDYADEYTKSAAESAVEVKFTNHTLGKPEKAKSGYTKMAGKFSISLGEGEDKVVIPHVRTFWTRQFGGYTCHLVTQVSTDNLKLATEGFEKIIESLKFKAPADEEDN